ncbi:MAG: DUF4118 domain-containing protein [Deltaproteobacteria bacterium]|nr:DUF4118 domain-containing protein [Deltaproteobacteria bacterium]
MRTNLTDWVRRYGLPLLLGLAAGAAARVGGAALQTAYYYLALAAVVMVALREGLPPALFTLGVGALLVSYMLPPSDSFRIVGAQAWERFVLYLFVGGMLSVVGASRRRAGLREAEARRRAERYVEVLEAERAMRERFVVALSHDLRTPLAAARLAMQLAMRKAGAPLEAADLSRRALNGIDRTLSMITDLLDSYRLVEGKRLPLNVQPLELVAFVQQAVSELRATFQMNIELGSSGAVDGFWDRDSIRRIVENLCINAAKYGQGAIRVQVGASARGARLSVHNDGEAIPEEIRAQLFEQFFRAPSAEQSARRGWGVGLMAVRALAEAHGGTVSVRSASGQGTTFIVDLPLGQSPSTTAPETALTSH